MSWLGSGCVLQCRLPTACLQTSAVALFTRGSVDEEVTQWIEKEAKRILDDEDESDWWKKGA